MLRCINIRKFIGKSSAWHHRAESNLPAESRGESRERQGGASVPARHLSRERYRVCQYPIQKALGRAPVSAPEITLVDRALRTNASVENGRWPESGCKPEELGARRER